MELKQACFYLLTDECIEKGQLKGQDIPGWGSYYNYKNSGIIIWPWKTVYGWAIFVNGQIVALRKKRGRVWKITRVLLDVNELRRRH